MPSPRCVSARSLALAILVSVCSLSLTSSAQGQTKFNLPKVRKGVVYIQRISAGTGTVTGSGFMVHKDGLVFTNQHVVVAEQKLATPPVLIVGVPSPKDPDTLRYFKAKLVYAPKNKDLDFAILKIARKKGEPAFPIVPITYTKMQLGAEVAALGFPAVTEEQPALSFNKGSISSTRVRFEGVNYYQTDVAINPGNSGGPLVNAKGEAVGIVTAKKRKADRIGFAVYLSEVKKVDEAMKLTAKIKVEPGPFNIKDLPRPKLIPVKKTDWDFSKATVKRKKGITMLEKNGAPYAITSTKNLPKNFQLIIRGQIQFLQGGQRIYVTQRDYLRTMCIRFATKDTNIGIMERKGYLIQVTHSVTKLYKNGKLLKLGGEGNKDRPFTLVVTKRGGKYTVVYNGKLYLEYTDKNPLAADQHKMSIGGYLSRLYIASISVTDLDRAGVAKK